VPIIKPAQKHKYNTKAAQIHKTNTKQTNKQTNKRKQYYRKRYIKVLGQNPYTLKKHRYVYFEMSNFSAKSVLKK
jgi:hypothetical protein